MDDAARQVRRKELESTELVRLVSIYRSIMGLGEVQPLPAGITYSGLIDAILDRSEHTSESPCQLSGWNHNQSRAAPLRPEK